MECRLLVIELVHCGSNSILKVRFLGDTLYVKILFVLIITLFRVWVIGSSPSLHTSVIQSSVPTVKLFRIAKATPGFWLGRWKTVEIVWNLRCKSFGLEIRQCKILNKSHVWAGCWNRQKGVARHLSPLTAPQVLTTRALLKLLKEKVKMEMNVKVAAH